MYLGYTIVALLMEFNTVFLHLRFMFVFHSVNKSYMSYKIVSTVNIGRFESTRHLQFLFFTFKNVLLHCNKVTFVIFRIMTVCWMVRWIVINRQVINNTLLFSIGSFGLALILLINMGLLQRLLQSDFKTTNIDKANESTMNNQKVK